MVMFQLFLIKEDTQPNLNFLNQIQAWLFLKVINFENIGIWDEDEIHDYGIP